jgi:hypothetical protein
LETKETEKVLRELLSFCVLPPGKRFQAVEQIAKIQALPARKCAARLIERVGEYCTFRIIDTEAALETSAEDRLEELYALTVLMLQSREDLWSQESIEGVGEWSLLSRAASEAMRSLRWEASDTIDAEALADLLAE